MEKLAGHTSFCWSCAFRKSKCTDFAASISFCETKALGTRSKMSRPRAISELYMWPLYQYTDQEPAFTSFVECIGPRSKKPISFGCAGSLQSKIEMPP